VRVHNRPKSSTLIDVAGISRDGAGAATSKAGAGAANGCNETKRRAVMSVNVEQHDCYSLVN